MAIVKKQIIPVIFGLNGYYLTKEEIKLIKSNLIFGFIFFERNIKSINQLKSLINHVKSLCDYKPIIMIDHEGGRVNRFNKIFDQSRYNAAFFSKLYRKDKIKFQKYFNFFTNFNINLFKYLGINTVAYPVLDLKYNKTHNVIGDRAFSNSVNLVKTISNLFIQKYQNYKISCIAKHAPGHGLATLDSHIKLPIVNETKSYLLNNDFKCFENVKSNFLMTAHIKYKNFDNEIATYSKKVINLLKKQYKFNGLIMTDDICMKALKGPLYKKVSQPLIAGCDIILHCDGNIDEMKKIISILTL